MVWLFEGESVPKLYWEILNTIMTKGKTIEPRGLTTLELSPVIMVSHNPRKRLFGHPNRKEVSIFTYIEGLWILLKEASVDRLAHYVPAMINFTHENTKFLDGAYGPAIGNQLEECFQRLYKDSASRQAIVIINQPHLHHLPTKDYPCTLSYQFLIRDNKLDMIVYMRSQDAWLGLVCDTGEFQWFQEIIAGWLGIDVGTYYHIDGSLHLYKRDWEKASLLIEKDKDWNLYKNATILDARMGKENFNNILNTLDLWETSCRTGSAGSVASIGRPNGFYTNLEQIIMAYNFRLLGYKKEAYNIVKKNRTDLGIIYEERWRNK